MHPNTKACAPTLSRLFPFYYLEERYGWVLTGSHIGHMPHRFAQQRMTWVTLNGCCWYYLTSDVIMTCRPITFGVRRLFNVQSIVLLFLPVCLAVVEIYAVRDWHRRLSIVFEFSLISQTGAQHSAKCIKTQQHSCSVNIFSASVLWKMSAIICPPDI